MPRGTCQRLRSNILLTFPPRPLSPPEQALLDEWLPLADDVPLAYVSQRRSDDPRFFGRVLIATGSDTKPSHSIHVPAGSALWLASGPTKVLVPTRIGVILGRREEFRHDRSVLVI
jgi:hypothetical protein